MFEKYLMIAGLKRQFRLLEDLMTQLEEKSRLDMSDCLMYSDRTQTVANNLRKLRKIKKDYCQYQDFDAIRQ